MLESAWITIKKMTKQKEAENMKQIISFDAGSSLMDLIEDYVQIRIEIAMECSHEYIVQSKKRSRKCKKCGFIKED